MVVKLADSIISPLGNTSHDNFRAVVEGRSALAPHSSLLGTALPEPFFASLFDWQNLPLNPQFSRFETLAIRAAEQALRQTDVDASAPNVRFFISTTKGNVEQLALSPENAAETGAGTAVSPTVSAQKIARFFGNPNISVTISNACTSGLCAIIAATRALQFGLCDVAVVVGAEVQSPFIVSGFQSFKALSPELCRPFDRDRVGLNLGEAAAAMVLSRADAAPANDLPHRWQLGKGAIRNDANHISGPSRTAEGSLACLQAVCREDDANHLAFINLHGTATLYNDEMESIAVARAGLLSVPVNSLKGYFGHTMGAAGVLEVILSMQAVEQGLVLGTRGFQTLGVSHLLSVSADHRSTDRRAFVKLLSGFGGVNAAMRFEFV